MRGRIQRPGSGVECSAMTNNEAKAALLEECPAVYAGITYQKVTALIYRKGSTRIQISAELLDRNGRAVVIAPAGKIERGTSNAKI